MLKKNFMIMIVFIIIFIVIKSDIVYGKKPPNITANSAIVIDIDSCSILYSKNKNKIMYPASTTKVLTSIIGLEIGNLNDIVNISPQASKVGEASIHLHAYDKIKFYDLIKGALIKSGNDAAFAIGEYIAGDEELFVYLMNKKAFLLGSFSSNFCNTNGLPDDQHVCTAYELAVIARYAMHNKIFSEIVSIKNDTIELINGEKRYLKNTNKLLWRYNFANGIKTGTTRKAGSCLVASATKNGKNFLVALLKSVDRYGDAEKLLEYALNNFNITYFPKGFDLGEINIKDGEKISTKIFTAHDISAVYEYNELDKFEIKLILPDYLNATVLEGENIGNIYFMLDGNIIDSSYVLVKEKVEASSFINRIMQISSKFD